MPISKAAFKLDVEKRGPQPPEALVPIRIPKETPSISIGFILFS